MRPEMPIGCGLQQGMGGGRAGCGSGRVAQITSLNEVWL